MFAQKVANSLEQECARKYGFAHSSSDCLPTLAMLAPEQAKTGRESGLSYKDDKRIFGQVITRIR